jgi:hypothetical protein
MARVARCKTQKLKAMEEKEEKGRQDMITNKIIKQARRKEWKKNGEKEKQIKEELLIVVEQINNLRKSTSAERKSISILS